MKTIVLLILLVAPAPAIAWNSNRNDGTFDVEKDSATFSDIIFQGREEKPLMILDTEHGAIWFNPEMKANDLTRQVMKIMRKRFPEICQGISSRVIVSDDFRPMREAIENRGVPLRAPGECTTAYREEDDDYGQVYYRVMICGKDRL